MWYLVAWKPKRIKHPKVGISKLLSDHYNVHQRSVVFITLDEKPAISGEKIPRKEANMNESLKYPLLLN